jgi:predicted dehydrogenase
MPQPLHLTFLGCGYITQVHSRHLSALRADVVCSYASRDRSKADRYRRQFHGVKAYSDYAAALADPSVDAVVIAVPPRFHLELALDALNAGKHVLVEKPAFPTIDSYAKAQQARDAVRRVVLVGENDHYKPLANTLRTLLHEGTIGQMLFAHFTTIARKFKSAGDWRNDAGMAGGDAFFEEGIHWLHLANSLGPKILRIHGYRPQASTNGNGAADMRPKSMMIAFEYDNTAVGSLYYSREVPSLLRGLHLSTLYGRDGVITFESNGGFVLARGKGIPRLMFPGFSDIRGYRAMYRDFLTSIREGRPPEMSLERAADDHLLMDRIYACFDPSVNRS